MFSLSTGIYCVLRFVYDFDNKIDPLELHLAIAEL